MIRVLIERHAQAGRLFLTLISEFRAEVMKQPGYISGETLVNTNNMYHIAFIITWNSIKDWESWQKSELRADLDRKIEALLVEPPKVTIFRHLSYKHTN